MHGGWSKRRWHVTWRGTALGGGLAIIAIVSPARAATPVFVDGAGACAGRSPCFMTIQAGINNAGPPPAVVNVFPGTYAESVDLSLMNGGMPGDLTVRTVNGSGVPTPGTASILPAAGVALRNSVSPYPGDITIDGFTIKSPNSDGISLGVIQGDLTLSGVVSDGNGLNGLEVEIQGDVTITDSSFSDNLNGFGMNFGVAADVTFDRVTVDGNKGFNALFSMTGIARLTDSSFSNSLTGSGLSFATATDVTFVRVTVDGNHNFNASVSMTGVLRITNSSFSNSTDNFGLSFATATDVTLEDVTVNGNHNFNASFSMTGVARITRSSFDDSVDNFGLSFSTPTDATLDRVTANGNDNFNASFSVTGSLRIVDASFNDSTTNFGLSFASPTGVTLTRVAVNGNSNFNASFSASGMVVITDASFSNSMTNFGLSMVTDGEATLVRVTADTNRNFNTSISAMDALRITDASFSGSVTSFGLSIFATDAVLRSVVVNGNATNGLQASVTNLDVRGSRFVNNTRDGVQLSPSEPDGVFRLSCSDIAGNQREGLVLQDPATVDAEQNYWGSPTGPTHPSNPNGTGDTVVDGANGGAGTVDFQPFLTTPSADSSVCHARAVPALGASALLLLLLALLVLPAWHLARRPPAERRS